MILGGLRTYATFLESLYRKDMVPGTIVGRFDHYFSASVRGSFGRSGQYSAVFIALTALKCILIALERT